MEIAIKFVAVVVDRQELIAGEYETNQEKGDYET